MEKQFVLQQQGPDEERFILSEDNRFVARLDECTDQEAKVLIAAPDLLNALVNLVADFDKSVITTDPMLIEARTAIAKATN